MKIEDAVSSEKPLAKPADLLGNEYVGKDDLTHIKNIGLKKPCNKIVELIRQDSLRSESSSIGQNSVDFNTAINKAGFGKFNYFLLLISFPATCTSGFDTGAMSFILPVASCDLNLSSIQISILNSIAYAGMISSAFLWGSLSDNYGRQRLLVLGYLLDALIVILSAFSSNFWLMALFRFFSGFMICGPYSIFVTYLSEMFDTTHRDFAVLSIGVYYSLGNILQPGLALAVIPMKISINLPFGLELNSWRLFLLLTSLPSLLSGIATAFCVESPKFLLDQGRKEEALNVFKKIYTINTGLPSNTYPFRLLTSSAQKKIGEKAP